MAELAKLFRNGGSQAVRLPRDHRFPGDMVRVTHFAGGTLLQPVLDTPEDWFAAMDAAGLGLPFLPEADRPAAKRAKATP